MESYTKEEVFSDLQVFSRRVWSGLEKVLPHLCKGDYFYNVEPGQPFTHWKRICKGQFYHEVGGVVIDVDASRSILIYKKDSEVVDTKAFKGTITEEGEGFEGSVHIFLDNRNIGYVSVTRLLDDSVLTALQLAADLSADTARIRLEKKWSGAIPSNN